MNSTSSMGSSRDLHTIQILLYVSVAGMLYFTIALFLLHQFSPEFDIRTRSLSEYAYGPNGYLLSSGLLALGTGSILFAYVLFHLKGAKGFLEKAGLSLLALWGLALIMDGLFPKDPAVESVALSYSVHRLASTVAFVSLVGASLLLSLSFRKSECLERVSRPALLLVAVIFLSFLVSTISHPAVQGLTQRLFIFFCLAWLLLVSLSICSISTLNKIYGQNRGGTNSW